MFNLILLTAVAEVASQLSIKKYQVSGQFFYMACGMLLYVMISWFLLKLYKHQAVGIVQALWSSFSIIMSLTLGVLFFNDKVDKVDCMAVAFIILGSSVLLGKSKNT